MIINYLFKRVDIRLLWGVDKLEGGQVRRQFTKKYWCTELQDKIIQKEYCGKNRREALSIVRYATRLLQSETL